MITLIKFICLYFYEQIKNAFLELVRIKETVEISETVTEADIAAMVAKANIHGAVTIASTAITTACVIYLFVYGFYDEIAVDVEGQEMVVKKVRKIAIILFALSIVIDGLSKVI